VLIHIDADEERSMIYLMRHGESTVNVDRIVKCRELDGDLTEKGREQARLAGHWLSDKSIRRIHASPFHRTQQSAEIVSEILGLTVETDDDLREIDCGDLEGRNDPESWDLWHAASQQWYEGEWDTPFAGGETQRNAHARFQRALLHACEQSTSDQNILLVTHGGISVRMLPHFVDLSQWPKTSHLDNTGIVVLAPTDDGRFTCGGWNMIEHLEISSES
jgi:probable phosphoglycerate mutase